MSNKMSRRGFVAGAAVVGVAAGAMGSAAWADQADQAWDASYDVVVVGYGAAGATAARFAAESAQGRRLLHRLRTTYIPEEFYFQNVFAGTPWEERITGDALRFSIWDEPQRGLPAVLNEGDLARADASGCVFARKVEAGSELYAILERRWAGKNG